MACKKGIIIATAIIAVAGFSASAHAAGKLKKVYRKRVGVAKLEPRYFVVMKDGAVHEGKELKRERGKLTLTRARGEKLVLMRKNVKFIFFGHYYRKAKQGRGKYSYYLKDLGAAENKQRWDKYELWRSQGGGPHWSDVYGNNKRVRR